MPLGSTARRKKPWTRCRSSGACADQQEQEALDMTAILKILSRQQEQEALDSAPFLQSLGRPAGAVTLGHGADPQEPSQTSRSRKPWTRWRSSGALADSRSWKPWTRRRSSGALADQQVQEALDTAPILRSPRRPAGAGSLGHGANPPEPWQTSRCGKPWTQRRSSGVSDTSWNQQHIALHSRVCKGAIF